MAEEVEKEKRGRGGKENSELTLVSDLMVEETGTLPDLMVEETGTLPDWIPHRVEEEFPVSESPPLCTVFLRADTWLRLMLNEKVLHPFIP